MIIRGYDKLIELLKRFRACRWWEEFVNGKG